LAVAEAINVAQMTGEEPDDLPELVLEMQKAAQQVIAAIQRIRELAQS
jgi:hypothetical protein